MMNPAVVLDVLHPIPSKAKVYVLFQNYSYDVHPRESLQTTRSRYVYESPLSLFRYKTSKRHHVSLNARFFLVMGDDWIQYVQFCHNLDILYKDIKEEMLYVGVPSGLEQLLQMILDVVKNLQDTRDEFNPPKRFTAPPKWHGGTIKDLIGSLKPKRVITPSTSTCHLVVQTPTKPMVSSLDQLFAVRDEGGPSVLHMSFPYVQAGYLQNVCTHVVSIVSRSSAQVASTNVVLSFPTRVGVHAFRHEGWMYRVVKSNRISWFMLTSSNLTMRSWGNDAVNYEVGTVVFDLEWNTPFMEQVRDRSRVYSTSYTVQNMMCDGRQVSPVNNRARLIVPIEGIECSLKSLDNKTRIRVDSCVAVQGKSAWDRFQAARRCLAHNLLAGLVGTEGLMSSWGMRRNMYIRWALYDLLFNQLMSSHRSRRLESFDDVKDSMLQYLYKIRDNRERSKDIIWKWLGCKHAMQTLDSLVDIYVKWSLAFTMFDRRIVPSPPLISKETIVSIDECRVGESGVVGEGDQATSYDTLSFLIQRMYSGQRVWWECTYGHRFFYSIRRLTTEVNPICMVCAKSQDLQRLYEVLQQHPDVVGLTVEFPLYVTSKTLRYDYFFLYKGELCAIEFDDRSHTRFDEPDIDFLNDPHRPHRDAVKNVVSYIFGIHLLRITAMTARANAMARYSLILDLFFRLVLQKPLHLKDSLHNQTETRFRSSVGKTISAKSLAYTSGVPKNGPISLVLSTQNPSHWGNRGKSKDEMLRLMITEGIAIHPCMQTGKFLVPVDAVFTNDSRLQNVTSLQIYLSSLEPKDGKYKLETGNPRGHVISGQASLHVILRKDGDMFFRESLCQPDAKYMEEDPLRMTPSKSSEVIMTSDERCVRIIAPQSRSLSTTMARIVSTPRPNADPEPVVDEFPIEWASAGKTVRYKNEMYLVQWVGWVQGQARIIIQDPTNNDKTESLGQDGHFAEIFHPTQNTSLSKALAEYGEKEGRSRRRRRSS